MIRMIVHFLKGDPSEAEVLFPCFCSISPLQFCRTVFILNRVFGEGVGTALIGMALFPLGIWNSLFYLLFLPTEMARKPQIYRFSILFLPVLYLVLSLLGGGPTAFMIGLIAFPSNAVVYAVSTGIKSMIKDFCKAKTRAFFICSHHF